ILGDKGYQGINKIHKNSKIPFKKPPKKDLDKEQINFNKTLGKERIIIEHINRRLKIFQILSSRYRNRHKRFGLRLNLMHRIYNFEQKYNVLLLEIK
ncbi:MAG: transposase, partial [Gomphosphaeria aponina SAG 52.96 = DSM 107014]|nr:transposase [Gomphosphaeria aponina SAG 52.96 = DSM 107014]